MIKKIIFIIIAFVSLFLSLALFKLGTSDFKNSDIKFNESSTADYKVYLKENNFFEEPYLGKDQIYISSLIDYIDIAFNYNIDFEKKLSGEYKYYIKGIISATQLNNKNNSYWEKEYILSEEKEVIYKDLDKIHLDTNIKVDYQKYNDLLLDFKKAYNLSVDGRLKIVLEVENELQDETKDESFEKKSNVMVSIPLTKAAIEVPIEITSSSGVGDLVSKKANNNNIVYTACKALALSLFILSAIIFVKVIVEMIKEKEKDGKYKNELRKILKNYDSIIVNTKNVLNISELNIIDVDSFNELIDAHNEVRQPINFTEDNFGATFILINDKTVWRYVLRKDIV